MNEDKVNENIYSRPIKDHGGNKYLRRIYPADGVGDPILVDVYSVLVAFDVTCPALQHACKKLLCTGIRGKGSKIDDIKGIFDAMWRALELQKIREGKKAHNKGGISDIMREVHKDTEGSEQGEIDA